jgi:hypothetical protein
VANVGIVAYCCAWGLYGPGRGEEEGEGERGGPRCLTMESETGSSTYLLQAARMDSISSLDVGYSCAPSGFQLSGSIESALRLVS